MFSTSLPDGLAVRDLRPADVRVDVELALQAVDDDLEVQLAHAGDDASGPSPRRMRRGRSGPPRRGAARPTPSLSWSAFDFGSTATEMTGSGNVIDSSTIGAFSAAERVAGRRVLEADAGGDLARRDLLALLAVVRVHLEDAADALGLAGRSC